MRVLGIVICLALVELFAEAVAEAAGEGAAGLVGPSLLHDIVLFSVKTALFMAVSAAVNIWVARYYLKLRGMHEVARRTA